MPRQGVGWAVLLPEALGENPFLPLPGFGGFLHSLLSLVHGHITPTSASMFISPHPLLVCVFSSDVKYFSLALGPTRIIPDDVKFLCLLISAKILFPNVVTLTGSRFLMLTYIFRRPPYQPRQSVDEKR